jgi:rapamycin-insensitive companion of mTOR
LFQQLKLLIEHSKTADLPQHIITSLDYNMAGDSRQLLAAALASRLAALRWTATRHMRVLLRAGVQAFDLWGIDMLLRAMMDREPAIAAEALVRHVVWQRVCVWLLIIIVRIFWMKRLTIAIVPSF